MRAFARLLGGLPLIFVLATPAFAWPAAADARAEQDLANVRRGAGDLFQAAKTGHPTLLADAEREVLAGLTDGLEASTSEGRIDAYRYGRVLEGYEEARHLFKELPYTLEVDPGPGLRPFTLTLRRHPIWDLTLHPLRGWQVEWVDSGVRLVAIAP